jgi:hypothetical protein
MSYTIPNYADAGFADQAEPDAGDFRIISDGSGTTGVVSGCAVTAQGSPDMTVAVAAGVVAVDGVRVAVAAGNVTITAADGTNPRFDLITVDSSGTKAAVAGTAAANAVYPTIPASVVVIATVYVPASDTAINTNQITDKRVVVAPNEHASGLWAPPDYALDAMSYDPQYGVGATIMVSQTVYVVRLLITRSKTYTTICTAIQTAGSGFTNSAVALYNSDGTVKYGESGSLNAVWNSAATAVKESSFGSQALSAGDEVLVALWAHATTPPTTFRSGTAGGNTNSFVNYTRSATTYRLSTAGTGQASMPAAPLTLTSASASFYWVGLK